MSAAIMSGREGVKSLTETGGVHVGQLTKLEDLAETGR